MKDRAKKKFHTQLVSSGQYFLSMIFDRFDEERQNDHGGWEECDDEDAVAFRELTEDEAVKATIEGFIKFLGTREGFDAVKTLSEPHREYALNHKDEDFCDICEGEGCDECEPEEVE